MGKGSPKGGCWKCGGPHYASACPKAPPKRGTAAKGKGKELQEKGGFKGKGDGKAGKGGKTGGGKGPKGGC